MDVYVIDGQGKHGFADSLEGLSPAACRLIWVDVTDPSLEERNFLRDFFGLHPLASERNLEREQQTRVAEFGDPATFLADTKA